ncbi:MAG: beta-propeller domain-containing protein [Candidatus Micrarchaeota archaeon]
MSRNKLIVVLVGLLLVVVLAGVIYSDSTQPISIHPSQPGSIHLSNFTYNSSSNLKNFESWQDVSLFLESAQSTNQYSGLRRDMMVTTSLPINAIAETTAAAPAAGSAKDFSTTNVQVQGVDEADEFKNDGTYLYTITNGRLAIVRAYPAENAALVSIINASNGTDGSSFTNLFVNGDKLVVFGSGSYRWKPLIEPLAKQFNQTLESTATGPGVPNRMAVAMIAPSIYPYPYYQDYSSFARVYDLSDRAKPVLIKEFNFKGDYVASRMIGNKVFLVFQESAYRNLPMPIYAVDGQLRDVQPNEISYFDSPFDSYSFTTVLGMDLNDLNKNESRKVILMGNGQNVYVSPENLYISYARYADYVPRWPIYEQVLNQSFTSEQIDKFAAVEALNLTQWREDNLKMQVAQNCLDSMPVDQRNVLYQEIYGAMNRIRDEGEATVIHKFSLTNEIQYLGKGEVHGHVLNQFSMDEYNGNFRIATTIGQVTREGSNSTNNVYVLNSTLGVIGRLEGLAPGEKIYSSRFMGERAYLVTFRKVDPLFVISLKEPTNPQVLGKLKIPGYSDYLHPYDETHLIGIGKDAVPSEEGDFAWYQGVKLTLFDVTNVSTPVELATYKIGDRGTESLALNDHKAFLFDKTRGLLVVPITLAEIDKKKYPQGVEPNQYGDYTFQGAYVFNVSLTSGFKLRDRISHANQKELDNSGEFYYGGFTNVKRSAYIGNVLYTVSDTYVKANSLSNLASIASVTLPLAPQVYPIMIE